MGTELQATLCFGSAFAGPSGCPWFSSTLKNLEIGKNKQRLEVCCLDLPLPEVVPPAKRQQPHASHFITNAMQPTCPGAWFQPGCFCSCLILGAQAAIAMLGNGIKHRVLSQGNSSARNMHKALGAQNTMVQWNVIVKQATLAQPQNSISSQAAKQTI